MYDLIAHYYDLSHNSLTDDLPLLHELAQEANGRILECGCGTGRILLPLARAGFTITGLDSSAAMLAIARQKLAHESARVQANVALQEGDMTDRTGNGRYALIIIPYNTLFHLTPTQLKQAFTSWRQSLTENGRLYIDLTNPFALAQTPNDRLLTLENSFTDPHNNQTILQFASSHLNHTEQILHTTWIYDATPAEGGPIHRTISQFSYHYLYPHQLEMQIRQTGFRLESMWGDYERTPFNEESERLILMARS